MSGRALAASVDLVVPNDLFDILASADRDEARDTFHELFAAMFPRMGPHDLTVMTEGLLTWREKLLADGVILHGLVAVPAGPETPTPVHWHILAGVVDVPSAVELDTGKLAAAYFGQELSEEHTYTESFDTEMGWGVGVITQAPISTIVAPAGMSNEPSAALPPVMGVAVGLSAPRGGDLGLLVVGISLGTEHTLEMAAIVAAIAGNSIIRLDATPDVQED